MSEFWAIVSVIGGISLITSGAIAACGILFIKQNTCAIVERFGKFHSIKHAGLRFRIPGIDKVKRTIRFEMQNLPTTVNTKLKDNAFVAVEFV